MVSGDPVVLPPAPHLMGSAWTWAGTWAPVGELCQAVLRVLTRVLSRSLVGMVAPCHHRVDSSGAGRRAPGMSTWPSDILGDRQPNRHQSAVQGVWAGT